MTEMTGYAPDGEQLGGGITGVILAGGRSRRMGHDKARMEIAGETLLARVEKVLRPFCTEVIIAGDRPDLARPDLPCYPDLYPGSALGGLYTGLYHARTPWIFAAACDLPFPSADLARALIARRSGYDAVVIRTDKGWEPLFAVYGKGCLGPMQQLLEQGNLRIYDCFPALRLCMLDPGELPTGWERALANLNTPDDVRQLVTDQS
jgi:molybdopterin-guanine dinucleotide biosynthesis protein A